MKRLILSLSLSESTDVSIPTIDQVRDALKNLSASFANAGHSQYAFWTGIWAAEVLHTAGNTDAALSYLLSEAPTSYDGVSEMVFNRFSCQMEYELVAEFPTYEELVGQVALCEGVAHDDAKSANAESFTDKPLPESMMAAVYPNPTTGQLFLELNPDHESLKIEIYDVNGRKVQSYHGFQGESLNVSSLNQGLYMLRIYDGFKCTSVRVQLTK